MSNKKYNNEIFDALIKNRNIQRLSDYIGYKVKMQFKCLIDVCNYTWFATPDNILHGKGCPECGRNRLNNAIIDERLKNKNIIRLGDYKGSMIKIPFKCLVDGYEWDCQPNTLINTQHGCPKCSNRVRLTNEEIDKRIEGKTFKRISDYKTGDTLIQFQCLLDGYTWGSSLGSIEKGQGCARCAGNEPLTNEIIDERLKGRNIIRLGDCKGANSKILLKCLNDDYEWETKVRTVLSGKGCPNCSTGKNEKRILKYLQDLYGEHNIISQFLIKTNKRKYFIDFCVNNILIEYQGGQHYEPVKKYGGKDTFIKQVKRDYEVREYCRGKNIRLIEIPYWFKHKEQYALISNLMTNE